MCRFASFVLFFTCLLNNLPVAEACGPYFLTPVFDYKYAPENPFDDFANGKIGIVKPSYHRVVLFAAYRYLNNGSFTSDEQKALVDVWQADFNNKDYENNDAGEAVKLWVEKRRDVFPKEEKPPAIYTEREYGGYDFFPNCTKNAFETAAQTLSDRAARYGADSADVKAWVAAQDAVFTNCTSGKQIPESADQTSVEWLRKDRAYQRAAAEFYSLDYEKAKNDFAEIAKDNDSPWRDTAEYLVARTLIRQASLTSDEVRRNVLYAEAEKQLQNLSKSGGKFADSSEKFMNLIKYRLHPQERVGELARTLSFGGSNNNFRQDLIDYYWLLDKFEKETLESEQKHKEDEKAAKEGESDSAIQEKVAAKLAEIGVSIDVKVLKDQVILDGKVPEGKMPDAVRIATETAKRKIRNNLIEETNNDADDNKDKLKIYFSSEDYTQHWTIYVEPDATDEEAIAKAEKIVGNPLTDGMKERIKSIRQYSYSTRFTNNVQPEYQGGYSAEKITSITLLPDFLHRDDMTEWLFDYQMQGAEAYIYALDKFKQNNSDLWLMTAISKAEIDSSNLKNLLEAAHRVSRSSPAYPTIAFHAARILIAQNKQAEARKLLDEILEHSDDLPISSRNQFLEQRAGLAETMDDFLRDSLKKPFAFQSDGDSLTIDELIAQEKSYYDAKYYTQSQTDYEREVEDRYKDAKAIENQLMFDDKAIEIINEHFSLAVLLEIEKSKILPDYLKERIAKAIWTRAVLLKNEQAAMKIIPEIIRFDSEAEVLFAAYLNAKTPAARRNTALYIVLKNENLSPYVAAGLGSPSEGYKQYASRWWCKPYNENSDEEAGEQNASNLSDKPKFLSAAQSLAAQRELRGLKTVGDAPASLGKQVLEWAKRSPLDKRVPESLYIVYEANGWDKYGCGSNEELRNQIGEVLKTRYPKDEWTQKLSEDEQ
jgi:hypothetical protein